MSNEFSPRSDYLGRIGFDFKNVSVTAPRNASPDERFLEIAVTAETALAASMAPRVRIPITDVSISIETALRITHAMLLAATGPEEHR